MAKPDASISDHHADIIIFKVMIYYLGLGRVFIIGTIVPRNQQLYQL